MGRAYDVESESSGFVRFYLQCQYYPSIYRVSHQDCAFTTLDQLLLVKISAK